MYMYVVYWYVLVVLVSCAELHYACACPSDVVTCVVM